MKTKIRNRYSLAGCRFASARHFRALAAKAKEPQEHRYFAEMADKFSKVGERLEKQARMFGPLVVTVK